jgi:hypothetical protein
VVSFHITIISCTQTLSLNVISHFVFHIELIQLSVCLRSGGSVGRPVRTGVSSACLLHAIRRFCWVIHLNSTVSLPFHSYTPHSLAVPSHVSTLLSLSSSSHSVHLYFLLIMRYTHIFKTLLHGAQYFLRTRKSFSYSRISQQYMKP